MTRSGRSRHSWTSLGRPPAAVPSRQLDGAIEGYVDHVLDRFGSDLSGLRIAVDCANGSYSGIAPAAFERLGAEVTAIANAPDGENINAGCGATDLAMLRERCAPVVTTSGSRSTGTATACGRGRER